MDTETRGLISGIINYVANHKKWREKMSKKSLAIVAIIIIGSVCCLVVAKYFPWQTIEPKPQIDIWNEIEKLNEGRDKYDKYTVYYDKSWTVAKKTYIAEGKILVSMDGWTEMKQSMIQNRPWLNILYLDEENRVIWYRALSESIIYCHY